MKNRELATEFADCLPNSKVFIVNPGIDETDHERYGIGAVTYLTCSDPIDSIIEASREDDSVTVEELLRGIAMNGPDGDAQIYVKNWEGQGYAYFDIKEVRRGPYHHSIILGAWRCGG
jgi:hypothetical protein